MANYKAVVNGNWSNLATWQDNSTGSFVASTVLPSSGDSVYLNNFTVLLDIDVIISSLRNDSTTNVNQGGRLNITTPRNVTCTGTGFVTLNGGGIFILVSTATNSTFNFIGDVYDSIWGGGGGQSFMDFGGSSNTLNFTGNLYALGNVSNYKYGLNIYNGNTLNFTGNIYGIGSTYTLNSLISLGTNSVANITGNIVNGRAVRNSQGTVNMVGNITGSTVCPIIDDGGGDLRYTNSSTYFYGNITAVSNINVIFQKKIYLINNQITSWQFQTNNISVYKTLYSSGVPLGNPVVGNVKKGTVYGGNNELTGIMNVPPPGSVTAGVSVDNTVGTAIINAEEMWNYDMSNSMNEPGTLGYKLKKMQPQILSNVGNIVT